MELPSNFSQFLPLIEYYRQVITAEEVKKILYAISRA
jgi:hypothetical protein